jgi:hypothetical protein
VKARLALALALAWLAGCGGAKQVTSPLAGRAEASASFDRADVAFGDDLTLTIEARSDPALEVELPQVRELAGFRVVDSGTARSESEGVLVERRWVRLRADQAGKQELPAFEVRYRPAAKTAASSSGARPSAGGAAPASDAGPWKTTTTAPLHLDVRSLLPAGDQPPAIREIKPLQPIHRRHPWLWIALGIAVVIAAAAALAWWLRRRRSRLAAAPVVPPVPAHVVALAALDRLAATEPVGDAAVRRFYFALSEIVRAYIEGRFGLNATDLTAQEILASMDRLDLSPEWARGLREFLYDTDGVKFAAQRPQRGEVAAILEWSRGFVEATRPREVEPAPAADATQEAA